MLKKNKRYTLIFLSILLGFVVSLFLLELMVRLFTDQSKMNRFSYPEGLFAKDIFKGNNGIYFTPNFNGHFAEGEISGEISINSKGCRDVERKYEVRDKFRILALGDSFTFGHGVEFHESFLTILEKSLNLKKDSFEIIKCASPGGSPEDYLRFLKFEGYKYKPDLVMVNLFVGNDILSVKASNERNIVNDNLTTIIKIKSYLKIHSQLYGFLVDRIKGQPILLNYLIKYGFGLGVGLADTNGINIMKKQYTAKEEKLWNNTFELLKEIKELSKIFLVVVLPSREQYDVKIRDNIVKRLAYNLNDLDPYSASKKMAFFFKKNNIVSIDLLDSFVLYYNNEDNNLNFKLDPHWNKNGHKFVASVLSREIRPILDKLVNKE